MAIMENTLINKVAQSGLITINLEDFYPKVELVSYDLKQYLFMELILKEKDFREALAAIDWKQYENKVLCVFCSTDAIIPVWAYMLVSSLASSAARMIYLGDQQAYIQYEYQQTLSHLDYTKFEGKRIVIKGCSDKPVPPAAYLEITRQLRPIAQSIFYGEPCSTVPIYKKPKA